jgi:hypothetical protein
MGAKLIPSSWPDNEGRNGSIGSNRRKSSSEKKKTDFRLSPIHVVNAAKYRHKSLILLCGGPGRTRTSNQAVMSAVRYPRNSAFMGLFVHLHTLLFTFVHAVSLVNHWSESDVQ